MGMKFRQPARFAVVLLIVALLLPAFAPVSAAGTGFYRVSDQQILDPEGKPAILKGVSFGNTNYGNPSDISDGPINDHDAGSYFELAAMGLDHVRFEINYGLFEDDDNPYSYKQSGFDWIDQNIKWAKAAGMYLIITMKHPQGGYQASTSQMDGPDDGGKSLWVGDDYEENQKRLVALWTEIARRYADEPTIIGYGLINEPVVPEKSTAEDTVNQLKDLYQRIADGLGQFGGCYFQNGGSAQWDGTVGHGGAGGSLKISGAYGDWDNANSWNQVFLDPGCTYKVSGWVKGGNGRQTPQVSCLYAEEIWRLDESFLRYMIEQYLEFGETYNVPMFVGEWGLHKTCYDRGAEEYIENLTALFNEYGLSSNFHSYHDSSFGLYLAEEWQQRTDRNETIYDLLTKYYGEASLENAFLYAEAENRMITVFLENSDPGLLLAAALDADGRMTALQTVPVTARAGNTVIPMPDCKSGAILRLFFLEPVTYSPLCPSKDISD